MPTDSTDNNNYGRQSNEAERDLAAKGGPSTGLGNPDAKHPVSTPYDSDLQTQIAAKSHKKPAREKDNNNASL